MENLGELRVEATRANLRTITFFIHGIGQRLDLTEQTLFDVELAVEEATTNIIDHAYGSERSGDIVVMAAQDEENLFIKLTDTGKPLDPNQVTPFDINAPVE